MRFLIDESVHSGVAPFLERHEHDVKVVGRDLPPSITDSAVLTAAASEQRVLVTSDSDFGDLVFAQRQTHTGVIYLRLRDSDLDTILTRLLAALQQQADPISEFIVVSPRTIRTRAP